MSGGERYERMLLERLPGHGIELELGIPVSRRLARDEIVDGWNITLLPPGLRWPVAPLAFTPYTLNLLLRRRVELLRGHSVLFTGPSLFAARAVARSSVPIVLHHLHTEGRRSGLESALLRRADAVITISEFSRRQLAEAGVSDERIHVVSPGIEGPAERNDDRVGWPGSGVKLLVVGPLIARKRSALALETLAELGRRRFAASLVVAGEGPCSRSLRRTAQSLGVANRVDWRGFVSEREKWALLHAADALVFPSALEGFAFAVGEAQRAGLAVVVARGTAAAELVEDGRTGLVVEPDVRSFADAVERLEDDDRRRALGEAARRSSARFSWDTCAARVADIYHAVGASGAASQG